MLLLHHLHHLANGARHVAGDDCRGVRQALRDADFTDVFLELFLEPEAERSDVVFGDSASARSIDFVIHSQVFLDILVVGFD